jgi:hypothetical protein
MKTKQTTTAQYKIRRLTPKPVVVINMYMITTIGNGANPKTPIHLANPSKLLTSECLAVLHYLRENLGRHSLHLKRLAILHELYRNPYRLTSTHCPA